MEISEYNACRSYVLKNASSEVKDRYPSNYRLYIYYSLDTLCYLYDDMKMVPEVAEDMILNKEITLHGMCFHQGEKCIKYRLNFIKYPKRPHIPRALRDFVYERDGYECKHCGTYKNLSIDHIIPFSKGGPDNILNYQTLCRSCNSKKYNN